MKKRKTAIAVWAARGVFILSLFIILFSVGQLITHHYDMLEARESAQSLLKAQTIPTTSKHLEPLPSTDTNQKATDQKATEEPQIKLLYTKRPENGEVFGTITLPSLGQTYPLVEGTTTENLAKGVGHYEGSVLPGETDNSVLAGHRGTVFRDLGEIKIGDKVIIKTYAGTFVYRISAQEIVDGDDRTVIVPRDHAVLTLVTCYPFNYIGHAPKRYVLTAQLIKLDRS